MSTILWGFVCWQAAMTGAGYAERWQAYHAARTAADARGKPLLNIGCPRPRGAASLNYPCGDVCLDIDPRMLGVCQSKRPTLGDVRAIPYPSGAFGAALCSHVLEHLPTVMDAKRGLAELNRVTDGPVIVLRPSRLSLGGWFTPGHFLWVDELPDGQLAFHQR